MEGKLAEAEEQIAEARGATYDIIFLPEGCLRCYLYARRQLYYPGLIFHLAGGKFINVEVKASSILYR